MCQPLRLLYVITFLLVTFEIFDLFTKEYNTDVVNL